MHGQRVEKLVGKNAAGGDVGRDFEGGVALPFLKKRRELHGHLIAARGRTLHGHIAQRGVKVRQLLLREFQNVLRQTAHARGGFHQQKLGGAIELLPHFGELARQQAAKDRMHVGTGVVIGEARGFRLAVVTVNRMVKALPHVLGKGDGAKAADAFGEKRGKRVMRKRLPWRVPCGGCPKRTGRRRGRGHQRGRSKRTRGKFRP